MRVLGKRCRRRLPISEERNNRSSDWSPGMSFQQFPSPLLRLSPRLTLSGDGSSLANINTFILADGALCWVIGAAPADDFRLLKTDATPPDGINVIAPIAGPGRWHRVTTGGGGGSIDVLDEGVSIGTFTALNFVGAGVTAAPGAPGEADIVIPGGGGGTGAVLSSVYSCDPGVSVLDAVYLSAADTVALADSDDAMKQPLIGIVESKPTAVTCVVAYYGEVTGFVGLTPGATYFLGTVPGTITTVAPSTPGNIVQRIGFARNATTLVVFTDRDWTEIT